MVPIEKLEFISAEACLVPDKGNTGFEIKRIDIEKFIEFGADLLLQVDGAHGIGSSTEFPGVKTESGIQAVKFPGQFKDLAFQFRRLRDQPFLIELQEPLHLDIL